MIRARVRRLSSRSRERLAERHASVDCHREPSRVLAGGARDLVLLFFAFACTVQTASGTIKYKISLEHPEHHLLHVTMAVTQASPGEAVRIPAWNALYQVRDFAHRVQDVEGAWATQTLGAGRWLPAHKLDKQTWEFGEAREAIMSLGPRDLIVSYAVEWDDPGPFNSQLNSHHAFLNLAEILMYLPNRRAEDVVVAFDGVPDGWQVLAELPAGQEPNSFTAPSYDALVDAPVEAGKFEQFAFDSGGAHFRVVVDAKEWNKAQLEDSLRRITAYELKVMGGAPFQQYTFFFHIGPFPEAGGGGMEHANCTAISSGSMEGAAAVAAHEFFHLWNVKRIRPQSLEPVDYTKEQYTRALWFAEGVTSAYGSYTLERSGLWSQAEFYGDLAGQITELQSRPARKWQSAEESSLDAWLEKYDGYRVPERSVSYYNKGQLLGVTLDLAIRDSTDNHKSLDDVLRRMNVEYAQAGKFYNDSEGVRAVVEEVAGRSFEDFFRRYVSGTDEIPYDKFLAFAGLELKTDAGRAPELGFQPRVAAGGVVRVASIAPGSPAEAAGLRLGDILVSVNGGSLAGFRRWLREHAPGDTIRVRVRRDDRELDIAYAVGAAEGVRYVVAESPHPSDKQRRIRDGLLHGATD